MKIEVRNETPAPAIPRLNVSVPEFAQAVGLSVDSAWRAVQQNKVRTVRFGRRRLVPIREVERFGAEGTVGLAQRAAK